MDWQKITHSHKLFEVITGSVARGISITHEDIEASDGRFNKLSDVDYRSVYALPLYYDWLLDKTPPDEIDFPGGGDNKGYSIRKFLKLAYAKPSPEMVELLFVQPEHVVMMTGVGKMLRDIGHKLVSSSLAHKMAAAAGLVDSSTIREMLLPGNIYPIVGKNHILGAALHNRESNPEKAHKQMADVLRRLWVAREMLAQPPREKTPDGTSHWSSAWEFAWDAYVTFQGSSSMPMPEFVSGDDGYMPVYIYEDKWRDIIKKARMGKLKWVEMLHYRNELFDDFNDAISRTHLKPHADKQWGQAFLTCFAKNLI